MKKQYLIGTSGWNYPDWIPKFYPTQLKSYEDLKFYSQKYNTVENNSSFYRISKPVTFKKWFTVTPDDFIFSLKLNRIFTHNHRLVLTPELEEELARVLTNIQELKHKLGCLLIQTPPSLKFDIPRLEKFLQTLTDQIADLEYQPDLAIELRNKHWMNKETYDLLKRYNVAWAIGHSSRYPWERVVTANFMYVRFHGPTKLFASLYSKKEMDEWWKYIQSAKKIKKVYVYFNNDFHGYAIDNSQYLQKKVLSKKKHYIA